MKNIPYAEAGELLRNARKKLGLTTVEIFEKLGLVGSFRTLYKYETGTRRIPAHYVELFAEVYKLDAHRLAQLSGYSDSRILKRINDSKIIITTADFEFLVTVSQGLKQSMTLSHMVELLRLRQPPTASS